MTMIATKPNFVHLLLLHSNGQEYAKIFQFTIKMDKKSVQKNCFSSLSCSDKTTNEKFDGHTLKYKDL